MGFGLSDKPEAESEYTLKRHVALITGLVEKLELKDITIVGQDWGGPIGLGFGIEHQGKVKSLVILNTLVPGIPDSFIFPAFSTSRVVQSVIE